MDMRSTSAFALMDRSNWANQHAAFLEVSARPTAEIENDRRLMDEIERAVRAAGYVPLRCLDVAVRDAFVVLSGVVPSYFMKQLAQEIAMHVADVQAVRNEVEVRQP